MAKPTAAMRSAAKKGLELHEQGEKVSTPKSLEVGRKIASGQDLAESHISDMAHFHSSHNCPKDAEDLLWGGPAGEIWAKSNIMRSLNTGFSGDMNELMKDKETHLSFEIYSEKCDLDEPVNLGPDENGLVWAPILRSGMLATRPGPNGEKLDEPLVFSPGHSSDQMTEIGLEDIVEAFNDGAIEYVTIPETHMNGTLENTGFIKELRITDSKKMPGEKVLMGGHSFTEPEAKEKVDRGTVASRSCGLLYDYKNTTTGKTYPVALEHVALTNKPWVGGLAPYGATGEDFSDRTVVPMMLSEKHLPGPENAPEPPIPPTKLAQETHKEPQDIKEKAKSEFLADIQWGDGLSYHDVERQINNILSHHGGGLDSGDYPYYYVIDVTDGKALVKVDYGLGSDDDAWVVPYTVDGENVNLSPFSDWVDVTQKWVDDTDDPDEDKKQLDKLKMSDTDLAVLTAKARKNLPKSSYVYPDEERYPIHDIDHARNALSRVAQHGTTEEQSKVRSAVYRKYPQIKKNKEGKTNTSDDPLKAASERRSSQQASKGGQMKLLMSEEQMDALGLSDEAKELIRKQNQELERTSAQLAESKVAEKKTRVAKEIDTLGDEGLKEHPALLAEIEKTLLSDDGDVALKLSLSQSGHTVEVNETATDIVQRIIKALPRNKEGKIAFGEIGSKIQSPLQGRPAANFSVNDKGEVEEKDGENQEPPTGADLAKSWISADPSLADDPMMKKMLALSGDNNGKGQ